ncbi:MAG: acyl-CoA dehydratase activase [Desulfobacteraceae bacterium]|jgi:predicted CoA-substrate-specific enzyme activase
MRSHPHILGIDIGSVSIAVVEITSHKQIVQSAYEFHRGDTAAKLKKILTGFNLKTIGGIAATASTPDIVNVNRQFDNRLSVIASALHFHDNVGSILLVGGEKFGLIRFDKIGNYLNFRSNTPCAAGTGSFLEQQANRLNLSGITELSRLAFNNKGAIPKIATRCAVFAKTDLAHAQQEGYSLSEICDGLCFGLARNIVDTLFRGDNFNTPVIFTGGVSLNRAVVQHIESLIGKKVIARDTLFYGAIGAALNLLDEFSSLKPIQLQSTDEILISKKARRYCFHAPLALNLSDYPNFDGIESYKFTANCSLAEFPVEVDIYEDLQPSGRHEAFLGIDIGSTSTKAVLIDTGQCVLAGLYTRTAGRPIQAVQGIFAAIDEMIRKKGIRLTIIGAGTTGSGRKLIGKIIGADMVIDEITTHARAATDIHPQVDTIIEIGGQDSKFTTLQNGRVTFSIMNNVCAAGTGSFIEEQAQKLGCSLSEYTMRTEHQKSPVSSDRCTVFMERDLNHYLSQGYTVSEVLAAVLHSVCENYLTKVADENSIGDVISFQGATAKNKALVAAFEQRLGRPIIVSRYCHLTGALGTALMLSEQDIPQTAFRGLDLYQKQIPLNSETCDLCTNHCKLTVADVDSERVAYGFLCGRDYDHKKYVNNNRTGFDLLKDRQKVFACKAGNHFKEAFSIGIPGALHLLEDLPFWKYFFDALGIKTVTSEGYQEAIEHGKHIAGAEFCAPLTALHGHIKHLMHQADYIFLPYYFEKKSKQKESRRQYCYYTQYSSCLASAIWGAEQKRRFLMPVVHYLYSNFHTKAQLYKMLKAISKNHISFFEVSAAYDRAREFMNACLSGWKKIYKKHTHQSTDLHVVLLGRPYTVLTGAMNKGIPNLFAALGIKPFFQDMLSYSNPDTKKIAPLLKQLHWHFATQILESAEVVAKLPGGYPVLMTAFKCSPDSFVIDYFKKIMKAHNKPYLILQLDEHDSKVGYETRVEAAIRSFQNHHSSRQTTRPATYSSIRSMSKTKDLLDKTLVLPNWDPITCNLIAANLKRAGIDARPLDETPSSIRKSLRYNTGQCLPLNIIAQEFIDYMHTHHLNPAKTTLWMAAGEIACNIKLYPHHIKRILNSYGNGMEKASVYVGGVSMADISMRLPVNNYFAYMFGGMIRKVGCKIRPYERHKGDTDRVIAKSVDILTDAFLGNRSKEDVVAEVVSNFEDIEIVRHSSFRPRPKVAIFGDLYARDNPVFNQGLIHFIEENGGEVITTPYSDYLKMISRPYVRKWLIEGHYLSAFSSQALLSTLKWKEIIYYRYFERILKEPMPEYDESVEDILSQYDVRIENTGESMDNLLKIYYIKKHYPDVSLFVQASPAFCCPALVTEAMTREIEQNTGTPVVSITYDGTGGNKNDVILPYLKYPRGCLRRDHRNFYGYLRRRRLRMYR